MKLMLESFEEGHVCISFEHPTRGQVACYTGHTLPEAVEGVILEFKMMQDAAIEALQRAGLVQGVMMFSPPKPEPEQVS